MIAEIEKPISEELKIPRKLSIRTCKCPYHQSTMSLHKSYQEISRATLDAIPARKIKSVAV